MISYQPNPWAFPDMGSGITQESALSLATQAVHGSNTVRSETNYKKLCRPKVSFFPLIKVIQQIFIEGISLNLRELQWRNIPLPDIGVHQLISDQGRCISAQILMGLKKKKKEKKIF